MNLIHERILVKSYVVKETSSSMCVSGNDHIRVMIQGESTCRRIPIDEFLFVTKTVEDPPHFRIRYLEPYIREVIFVKHKDLCMVCIDDEGNKMLIPHRLKVED